MISIIIPTYVEEKIIAETILKLKKDLILPHEIIVADGNSPDNTVSIAKKYADKVITPDTQGRRNASQNRNAGARVAEGEFLVFLDASCTIPNTDKFFDRCLKHFNKNNKLVALTTLVRVTPEKENIPDRIFFGLNDLGYYIMNNILNIGAAVGKFQMIRKDAYLKIGGYREDLPAGEDIDMFRRLAKIGKVRSDIKLTVFHSGRRAHKVGWINLLYLWIANAVSVWLFNKSYSKEWPVVR